MNEIIIFMIIYTKLDSMFLNEQFEEKQMIYWVDAKVSADFFSFLCFKIETKYDYQPMLLVIFKEFFIGR